MLSANGWKDADLQVSEAGSNSGTSWRTRARPEYQGHTFTFREDGYFNMTKAAKHFGKDLSNFMRSSDTQDYIGALSVHFTDKGMVEVQRGSGLLPQVGTWAHPKLAVFFARWLDVRFAVWCDLMVDEILRGRLEVQPVAAQVTQDRGLEDIVKAILPVLLPKVVGQAALIGRRDATGARLTQSRG